VKRGKKEEKMSQSCPDAGGKGKKRGGKKSASPPHASMLQGAKRQRKTKSSNTANWEVKGHLNNSGRTTDGLEGGGHSFDRTVTKPKRRKQGSK